METSSALRQSNLDRKEPEETTTPQSAIRHRFPFLPRSGPGISDRSIAEFGPFDAGRRNRQADYPAACTHFCVHGLSRGVADEQMHRAIPANPGTADDRLRVGRGIGARLGKDDSLLFLHFPRNRTYVRPSSFSPTLSVMHTSFVPNANDSTGCRAVTMPPSGERWRNSARSRFTSCLSSLTAYPAEKETSPSAASFCRH